MSTLESQRRRTPCVGICSTTYGDLVCRGCKRFAHEIVGWNGYTVVQQQTVESRLRSLRLGAIQTVLKRAASSLLPDEPEALLAALMVELEPPRTGAAWRAYWASAGVQVGETINDPLELQQAIDAEWLARSRGVYERNFRVAAE